VCDGLYSEPAVEMDIIDDYTVLDGPIYWHYTTFEAITSPFDSASISYQAVMIHNSQVVPVYIDEIIIDTISVPEPAMLALLALGGVLIRRKR
jgi:hypothetical protein